MGAPLLGQDREELGHFVEASTTVTRAEGHPGDLQVLGHGEVGEDPPVLGDEGHATAQHLVGGRTGDVLAVEAHRPRGRGQQPGDRGQRRGLARAVGADERDDLALVDPQPEVPDRGDRPVAGGQSRRARAQRPRPDGAGQREPPTDGSTPSHSPGMKLSARVISPSTIWWMNTGLIGVPLVPGVGHRLGDQLQVLGRLDLLGDGLGVERPDPGVGVGHDEHGVGGQGPEADGLQRLAVLGLVGVEEGLHAGALTREAVGRVVDAFGVRPRRDDPGGVERIGPDHLDVTEAGGVELTEQGADQRHQHRGVEHVGRLGQVGHGVDLGREVGVLQGVRVVLEHLTAAGLVDLGEGGRVLLEVGGVRRGEGDRRLPALAEGELGGGRGLGRVVEGDEERVQLGVGEHRLGRGHEQHRDLSVDHLQQR